MSDKEYNSEAMSTIASGLPIMARVALVVAHQDDECIAAAGIMHRLRALTLIHTTNGCSETYTGAAADHLRQHNPISTRRREEVDCALRASAPGITRRIEYTFPDGKLPNNLPELKTRLYRDLMAIDIVVTHPYEGGHCDHDATAQAVQSVCQRLLADTGRAPARLEFSSYFKFSGTVKTGDFLPNGNGVAVKIVLDDAAQRRKQAAFSCFKSQTDNLRFFSTRHESFRVAPIYDFLTAPGLPICDV